MSTTKALRLSLALSHCGLLVAVAAVPLGYGMRASSAAVATAAALPLLLAIPGLRAGRPTTYQWLSLVLVLFVGAASVEVVASAGRAAPGIAILLLALAELAVVLALIRRPSRPGRA